MTIRLSILAVPLILVACNPFRHVMPLDGTVCIQDGSSNIVAEITIDAVERWRMATNGLVDLNVVYGTSDSCDAVVSASVLKKKWAAYCHYSADNNEIVIDIFRGYGHSKHVKAMVHELGHAMGADHSDDPDDAMHVPSSDNITPADVIAVQSAQ